MRDIVLASLLFLFLAIAALVPALGGTAGDAASRASASPTAASTASRPSTAHPTAIPTMAGASPSPRAFPSSATPIEFALPSSCQILSALRHDRDAGVTWRVQCGSAQANRAVADLTAAQGWTRLDGPPIGVGLQNYVKVTQNGPMLMQLAWVLSGPTPFADPFSIVQSLQ